MSRTKRKPQLRHYWGCTKREAAKLAESFKGTRYEDRFYHDYRLHGTDNTNVSYGTREYFNRAHRIGRAIVRNKLRPHLVQDEDYYFDDSRYYRVYKQVWWEIY